MKKLLLGLGCCWLAAGIPGSCPAWDYEGHRLVNKLALASLPAGFPDFALTSEARERIAFLGGEPDRWRNIQDLNHVNAPDHYFDLEELPLYRLELQSLTHFRYDFTAKLAVVRATHPERFPAINPDLDRDHTRQWMGFLPWSIMENYDRLKSGFSYLKALQQAGTPAEVANARQNILYAMGVMGHYVGDGAQPLHTTTEYNGWVGDNPKHYTTDRRFHAWIDGGYFVKIGGLDLKEIEPAIRPARSLLLAREDGTTVDLFSRILLYLRDQNKQVEPLYQLEKDGKLTGDGELGREGKALLTKQLVAGGQMLGDLWYTAWKDSTPDAYLLRQLALRNPAQTNAPASK